MKNEKLKVGQQFDVDIISPTCNLIENKTPQQIFFFEFSEFFQSDYDFNEIVSQAFF